MELLAANLVNPDPLLAELAAWSLFRNYRNYYYDTLIRFEKKDAVKLSGVIRQIKSRDKNTGLLIFEKIMLLKNIELFAPVHEMDILHLVAGIAEPEDIPVHPRVESFDYPLEIQADNGYILHIPGEKILEMMTGDPVMTERYLRLYFNNNHAYTKDYE
jgi:hypothetical protein